MTGLAFICGVAPMVIAHGASAKSQQALGTSVMGGMVAVVILALLLVPVFFVAVRHTFARRAHESEATEETAITDEERRDRTGNAAAADSAAH
jgi:multidrug efflux pump